MQDTIGKLGSRSSVKFLLRLIFICYKTFSRMPHAPTESIYCIRNLLNITFKYYYKARVGVLYQI
jgi:hypothetical protein